MHKRSFFERLQQLWKKSNLLKVADIDITLKKVSTLDEGCRVISAKEIEEQRFKDE